MHPSALYADSVHGISLGRVWPRRLEEDPWRACGQGGLKKILRQEGVAKEVEEAPGRGDSNQLHGTY